MMRLDDATVRRFLVDGYLVLKTSLPESFHQRLFEKFERIFAEEGNPGNNMIPRAPELMEVFHDPAVAGALESLFGPDWYLHPHRHPHRNPPRSEGQQMHKDSWMRLHPMARWGMLFYYPQPTPEERGPTGVQPGSHLYNRMPEHIPELPLTGEAGTVAIVHYDIWHRAMPNRTDQPRFMMKFLLTRLSEPGRPDWDSRSAAWEETPGPLDQRAYRRVWAWQRGDSIAAAGVPLLEKVSDLREALLSEDETARLNAAYALADAGEEGREVLAAAVREGSPAVRRSAVYGLIAQGREALEALRSLTSQEDSTVRTLAVDAIGAIGNEAAEAVGTLIDAATDPSVEVRRRAVEGIGTVAQRTGEGVSTLADALRDPDDWVRRNASLALLRLAPRAEKAVPALRAALSDPNRYVRAHAAKALLRIGTPEALGAAIPFYEVSRWCPDTTPRSTF